MNNIFNKINALRSGIAALVLSISLGVVIPTAPVGAQTQNPTDQAAMEAPVITGISMDGENLIVQVSVPAGLKKIILEGRSRIGQGAWVPKAVQRLGGTDAVTVTFTIAAESETEVLRVRAHAEDPLPAGFYDGIDEFEGTVSDSNIVAGPETAVDDNRFGAPAEGDAENREVQESDIWAFRGDKLYFFNRLDGLQVIDLSTPDAPVIEKRFFLPAAGEQMYVIDDSHVALLVNDYCHYYGDDTASQVLVINVAADQPFITGSIRVPGHFIETRLVGQVLYTCSSEYKRITSPDNNETTWVQGSSVVSIQLSDPSAPAKVDEIFYPGWSDAVSATDEYFFVSTRGQWPFRQSQLHVVNIADPDGTMTENVTIPVEGWIKDKFKISFKEDVLSLIAEVRDQNGRLTHTSLVNYSLATEGRASRTGGVVLGKNEMLFATRFDGDKVYIVTFERIDPLWIVDNSNPARPVILGELEIPGWSTYIHPMGDRLITMGIDNVEGWQPAVQLFDVSDPSTPTLMSKVLLGDTWAWSEANSDEKAFRVLSDQGLILVPFSAWSNRQSQSGVQLIDFDSEELTLRGVIDHDFTPRRATSYNDLIYSISNHELVTVDAADRDNPDVLGELTLANGADHVIEFGDYLLTTANSWEARNKTTINVVSSDDLENPISTIELTLPESLEGSPSDYNFAGWFAHGDSIFLAVATEPLEAGKPADGDEREISEFYSWLSVYSLSQSSSGSDESPIVVTAEKHFRIDDLGWNPSLSARVFDDGTVVMTRKAGYNWFFLDDVIWGGRFAPWGWGMSPLFISMDVSDPAAVSLESQFAVESPVDPESGSWVDYSEILWKDRMAFYSTQSSRMVEVTGDGKVNPETGIPDPRQVWVTSHALVKVDFTDPSTPTEHPPLTLPGRLVGLTHGGNILYTTGHTYSNEGEPNMRENAIHASAYDEVSVRLLDTYPVNSLPWQTVTSNDALIYSEWNSDEQSYYLHALTISSQGKIRNVSQLILPSWPQTLQERDGLVIGSFGGTEGVMALDFSDLESPEIIAKWTIQGCIYPNIQNLSGSRENGFWIPLGIYGIGFFDVTENED